jgi:phosphoribosylanthranilate isomerase
MGISIILVGSFASGKASPLATTGIGNRCIDYKTTSSGLYVRWVYAGGLTALDVKNYIQILSVGGLAALDVKNYIQMALRPWFNRSGCKKLHPDDTPPVV